LKKRGETTSFGKCFGIYQNIKYFGTPGASQNLFTKTCFFYHEQKVQRKLASPVREKIAKIAGSRRVLATAVDDWSGKSYCVSS
jgi:hypothetical protein